MLFRMIAAIPPVAMLVQAAWGKLDFALIDRRLQPMTLLLQNLDEYLAAVGVAVAKSDALLPEHQRARNARRAARHAHAATGARP